jgi:hypothetical protein
MQKQIAKSLSQTIIFNVEAVAMTNTSKKDRLTHIFLNQLNRHRGYNAVNIPLALYLEKHLDKLGKFKQFKDLIKAELNADWDKHALDLFSVKLRKVLDLAGQIDKDIDVENLRLKLTAEEHITIKDTLVPELVDYLADKPDNFRLIFMVDEISQYIGSDVELLLNLQTIVEAIEEPCRRRVWLVATAQQTLDHVVELISNSNTIVDADAVGKILGRFEVRISLDSHEASFITQRRVLDKKTSVVPELDYYYNVNKEEISNKFVFLNANYKNYASDKAFILAYPFVPYQFKLIADVFDAFANSGYVIKEVKDNERSVLGITHKTVKMFADKHLGDFVPFDAFFNDTFKANLTHKANRILQPAITNDFFKDYEFGKRVVFALFMISHLSSVSKKQFASSLDNLLILLISRLDENRNELLAEIEKTIHFLMGINTIYEEDGNYFFYKEDELDVATAINNTKVPNDERSGYFYEILRELLKNDTKVTFNNNNFALKFFLDGKMLNTKGDIDVKFVVFEPKNLNAMALANADRTLVFALNEWMADDNSLFNDFMYFIKTKAYLLSAKNEGSTEREKTNMRFAERNKKLYQSIVERVKKHFSETPAIAGHKIILPEDIPGNSPDKKYKAALDMHFELVYNYYKLAEKYAHSNEDLMRNAQHHQTTINNELTEAETRVMNQLANDGGEMLVSDLCDYFFLPPFGWKEIALLDILRALWQKKQVKFIHRNIEISDASEYVNHAKITSERKAMLVKPGDKISPEEINNAIAICSDIFNKPFDHYSDADSFIKKMREDLLAKLLDKLEKLEDKYARWIFASAIRSLHHHFKQLFEKRNPKEFFSFIKQNQPNLKAAFDQYSELEHFVELNFADYKAISEFVSANITNFSYLGAADALNAKWMEEYFKNDVNPATQFRMLKKNYAGVQRDLNAELENWRAKCKNANVQTEDQLMAQIAQLSLPREWMEKWKKDAENAEKLNKLTEIDLWISKLDNYKADYVRWLLEEKAKEDRLQKLKEDAEKPQQPIPLYPDGDAPELPPVLEKQKKTSVDFSPAKLKSTATISSAKDVDEYVELLRKQLLALLEEAKTIILK